jgi:pimeloyl-ACP methyl ester carboxylesterase
VYLPFKAIQWAGHALSLAQGFKVHALPVGSTGRGVVVYQREGTGSGPPILLVHGLGGAATSFAPLTRLLLPLCKELFLVDLPGHGRAALLPGEAPAGPLELAQGVGTALLFANHSEKSGGPVLLAGNSLGGALVMAAALLLPERVAGVVGLAPAGAPLAGADHAQVLQAFRGGTEAALEMGAKLYYSPPRAMRLFARDLGVHWGSPPVQHVLQQLEDGAPVLPEEDLRALERPVLVLWGDSDGVLPASGAEFYRRALPPGSVEVLEKCGHLPQLERPREVAGRIAAFIARLAPGAQK